MRLPVPSYEIAEIRVQILFLFGFLAGLLVDLTCGWIAAA
jgi:hypothetical protein